MISDDVNKRLLKLGEIKSDDLALLSRLFSRLALSIFYVILNPESSRREFFIQEVNRSCFWIATASRIGNIDTTIRGQN